MKILAVKTHSTIDCDLQRLFSRNQHEAIVETVAEADLLQVANRYNLIVLNVSSPDLDGIDLCRQLRQHDCQAPILLLLESGDSRQIELAIEAGATEFVTRPFSDHELIGRVSLLQSYFEQGVHQQTSTKLQRQLDQVRLITKITDSIRETLDLDKILQAAVSQVRQFLQTDRVIIFRFEPDWQGVVAAESVDSKWTQTLGMRIQDSCFGKLYSEHYTKGRVAVVSDVETADIAPCYVALLNLFQIQANLVVPVLQDDRLWGLLIAHHCRAPREWQPESTLLLQQVAAQLAIAIQQAELYQQTKRELIERRQIQAALQKSEERFRLLSAFAPVGIYETDVEGHCTYTNACWQAMAGLTFEESLGDSWVKAIHPDDREKVFLAWTELVNGDRDFELEYRFINQKNGGRVHWVLGKAIAIHTSTGELVGYVGVNEDITARKEAERKIREQAALIDIASDAIFVRDLSNSRITFWSRGAEQLYGWRAEEAIGKVAHELFNKTLSEIQDALDVTMAKGFWQGELTQKTKAGDTILVASRWTLIRDDKDSPQSLLTVNSDITDKKRLESQFYRAQRLESLGRLAGGIAHDLGNVLTPVLGTAQLLRLMIKNPDRMTQEQLNILEQSARRGAEMVKQILTFAQGNAENKKTIDILVVIQEVVNLARQGFPNSIEIYQTVREPAATAAEKLSPHKPPSSYSTQLIREVSADSTHLHQVFMNLCVNARDAMPDGGILTISVENCVVDEAMAAKYLEATAGTYVVVAVTDTGVGIAPEIQDRIFDPFFTTKGPDEGTGLGLATVAGIVKKMDGFLLLSSEVEKGTEIKVFLPVLLSQLPCSTNS